MPTAAVLTWGGQKIEPYYRPDLAILQSVKLPNSINYAKGTVLGEKIGTNETDVLTITGGPTGGTFTLTFGGQTTAAIPYNATADAIRDALEALSTIGDGNVLVTGGPLPGAAVTIEFRGTLAGTDVGAITTSGASLTGGSSPASVITAGTAGAAGTPGTFAAYDNDNTDGSGVAKAILPFDVSTDSAGKITLTSTSGQAGDELGFQLQSIPVYVAGYFKTSELTGLDTRAASQPGWRLLSGTVADGIVAVGL